MFEVTVEQTFAAGHALRHYKGKCENVHGHNYRVQVTVEGEKLNRIGLLVDFVELKRVVRHTCERLDHQFINDLEPFTNRVALSLELMREPRQILIALARQQVHEPLAKLR